jgi:YidC/Oxa1 family membrane protein insertase
MNDIKRTVLWVIFGFSMVLLWDKWQVHNGNKPLFFPANSPAVVGPSVSNPTQAMSSSSNELPQSGAAPAASLIQGKEQTTPKTSEAPVQLYTLKNDVIELTISSEGATIVKAKLLKQTDPKDNTQLVTLLDQNASRIYLAQSGLIGASSSNAYPNHKTLMQLVSQEESKASDLPSRITFETVEAGGVKLKKTLALKPGQYDVELSNTIVNQTQQPVHPKLYVQIVRDGNKPEGESSFYSTFTGPAVYTAEKKYQKVEFKDIEKNNLSFQDHSESGYVAMVQHYYASAWFFDDNRAREIFTKKIDTNLYSVGMISDVSDIAPGQTVQTKEHFYVGPQEEKRLEILYPGLELVKDYGWLTILAKPLYWLLYKINTVIGNWGWSIVALVLLLKAAFFWINAQAYKSMAKMKAIGPKITEMRERLKDKPQQIQMEMMRIYKEEKVNPMGGCLPIVIQIPVFMALYWVLLSTVEMRNTPWVGWIHDLSAPDPFYILPFLMTATSLLQTMLNPTPPDPVQAKMMWIMPLAFSVMFFFFPAGLVLYWLTNNILSISQQWLINKKLGVTG